MGNRKVDLGSHSLPHSSHVHLDFHTAPELCLIAVVEVLLYVHRNHRLITRDGSPGRTLRLSHSS